MQRKNKKYYRQSLLEDVFFACFRVPEDEEEGRWLTAAQMFQVMTKRKHPIKYTIPNITKAAIPIVGYAAFAIYSHSFFHLCGSSCSSSSFVAFCIYGILAITSFR